GLRGGPARLRRGHGLVRSGGGADGDLQREAVAGGRGATRALPCDDRLASGRRARRRHSARGRIGRRPRAGTERGGRPRPGGLIQGSASRRTSRGWGPAVRGELINGEMTMARTYNVIDADGHILEPVDIWDRYIDPAYRDRAPKIIIDKDGKERLLV